MDRTISHVRHIVLLSLLSLLSLGLGLESSANLSNDIIARGQFSH